MTGRGALLRIETFNAAPAPEVAEALRACADIPSWVHDLAAGRPYADASALLARADELARAWTPQDVQGAIARHPRIGERSSAPAREAAMSAHEQSGVSTDDETRARLAAGNVEYESRFGHVFLIRAAGRSAEDVLAALEERLGNDPQAELLVVADELRQIALLRLRSVLDR